MTYTEIPKPGQPSYSDVKPTIRDDFVFQDEEIYNFQDNEKFVIQINTDILYTNIPKV